MTPAIVALGAFGIVAGTILVAMAFVTFLTDWLD